MSIRQPHPDAMPRAPRRAWLRGWLLVLLSSTLTFAGATVRADSYDEQRVRAGARLFRSLLAADTRITDKAASDGALHVLIYAPDGTDIAEVRDLLSPAGDPAKAGVRGLPVRVDVIDHVPDGDAPAPAGLFVAGLPGSADLDGLIRWSIDHKVMVYSPFEGHVERGALAGHVVEAQIKILVNESTLQRTGIELKPFFLSRVKLVR